MILENFQKQVHELAKKNGFWERPNVAEKSMLIVSEMSEFLEADRSDKVCVSDINKAFNERDIEVFKNYFQTYIKDTAEDELADVLIRLLDLAEYLGVDLAKHARMKHRFNSTRPYRHGKKY